MTSVQINLPSIPAELKNVSPYISRAQELKGKEPIIAYYCLLHATQTSITAKDKESKAFLMSLMTILEKMKEQLKDHKEITSDPAAATYIENFAIKVFSNADNEDRRGGSTRSTAKKFLAASNFFELLSMFEAKYLNPTVQAEEKIKYSKWKAADIAKAYREGRAPHPGTVGDGSGDESGGRPVTPHSELEDASIGYSKSGTVGGRASPNITDFDEYTAVSQSSSKPPLQNNNSSSSTQTLAPPKSSTITPKHISTTSTMPSPYVVDLSSPASSTGLRTPFKSPGFSDGGWSTAATPGIESPNMFAAYGAGMAGRPGMSVNPANLALFNAMKGLSPTSPIQRSPLGGNVITAASGVAKGIDRPDQKTSEDGVDTDEEDGQWSTAGNDPFSRQNSMMPSGSSFSHAHAGPSVVVSSSLSSVQEESPSKPVKGSDTQTIPTTQVLMVPLPPSASNSATSSPQLRPDSATFAAQHPLPPVLPPATQTPSSIKSDSHALPQGSLDDPNFSYTSTIIGDASDVETNHRLRRRRANSVSASEKNTANLPTPGPGHVRATSINALASPPSKSETPTQTNGFASSASAPPSSLPTGRLSPEEEDWERSSLSRLARLPDKRVGDDISGRLRDLGSYDSSSSASSPAGGVPDGDIKSRRNTLRAGLGPVSGDFSGFALPGVPSAPPADDWVNHTDKKSGGGGSDSDGSGGDIAARLPSAPPFLPTVQDQMPHVTVITKPTSPKEELRVNPYFLPDTPNASVGDGESPITPRNPSDQRASTYTNGIGGPNTHTALNHITSPYSASTNSQPGSSIHRGYTPPNSVVSPSQGSTLTSAPRSPPTAMHPPPVFSPPPPPPVPQAGAYFPSQYSQPAVPVYYSNQVPTNGTTPHRDEFGLEVSGRPPPTELEPEVLGKVQKHAKYALSALNFEDLDTAREELKKALRLLY